MTSRAGLALALALTAVPAAAQDLPDLCSDRPDRGLSPCVMPRGVVQYETSFADLTRDRGESELLLADSLLKLGLGGETDLRIGWSPYVRRDVDGRVETGVGDMSLALRHRLVDGGERSASFGVQGQVTLPTGGSLGDGDWSAELFLPVGVPLSEAISLSLTPSIAADADEDGRGRHLALGGVATVEADLGERVSAGVELYSRLDRDPAGQTTQVALDLFGAWRVSRGVQLDAGLFFGLNRDTADVQMLSGVTVRL